MQRGGIVQCPPPRHPPNGPGLLPVFQARIVGRMPASSPSLSRWDYRPVDDTAAGSARYGAKRSPSPSQPEASPLHRLPVSGAGAPGAVRRFPSGKPARPDPARRLAPGRAAQAPPTTAGWPPATAGYPTHWIYRRAVPPSCAQNELATARQLRPHILERSGREPEASAVRRGEVVVCDADHTEECEECLVPAGRPTPGSKGWGGEWSTRGRPALTDRIVAPCTRGIASGCTRLGSPHRRPHLSTPHARRYVILGSGPGAWGGRSTVTPRCRPRSVMRSTRRPLRSCARALPDACWAGAVGQGRLAAALVPDSLGPIDDNLGRRQLRARRVGPAGR